MLVIISESGLTMGVISVLTWSRKIVVDCMPPFHRTFQFNFLSFSLNSCNSLYAILVQVGASKEPQAFLFLNFSRLNSTQPCLHLSSSIAICDLWLWMVYVNHINSGKSFYLAYCVFLCFEDSEKGHTAWVVKHFTSSILQIWNANLLFPSSENFDIFSYCRKQVFFPFIWISVFVSSFAPPSIPRHLLRPHPQGSQFQPISRWK